MLLGILFFLSTFFNPIFQDKKFNKDNFISKIKLDAETYNINDSFVNDILFVWQSKLSLNEKNKLIEILNGITTNKNDSYNSQYFSFLDYVTLLYDNNVTLSSNFLQIISYHDEQAKLNNTSILNEINYVSNILKEKNYTQNKLKKILYSGGRLVFSIEKVEKDEADMFYFQEEEENNEELNLVINFNNINMDVITKNDSFKILNTSLKYSDNQQVLEGVGGKINLDLQVELIGKISLELGSYYLDQNNVSILSSNSTLQSNLSNQVEGIFEYNSKRIQKEKNYFSFTSNSNKINIPINKSTRLVSGISIEGKSFSTASSVGKKSQIITLLPGANKLIFESINFLIDKEQVSSDDSRFVFLHGNDSLYHESVRLQFNLQLNHLILYRSKGSLKNASYTSSFFDVSINADMLDWDLGSDNFLLKNITAANQRPVIIESSNYFSRQRVQQLTNMNGINILKIIVNYSNLKRSNEFYLNDVASHFKMRDSAFKNGLIQLWQNGFIQYDPLVGYIKLNYKIKHYYYSQINKRDYDQINFNSISPSSQNIKFDLKNKMLKINGVKDIILSEENNITIYPKEKTIDLLQNLDIKCVGDISVGNFDFKGANMSFDYKDFVLKLDKIDTLKIKSKNTEIAEEDKVYTELDSTLISNEIKKKPLDESDMYNYLYSIDGSIFINHPKNKSARKPLPNYPYFVSDQGTGVYFDLPEEYGEEYDSTFYFTINQFRIDSLDKPQLPLFEFDGVFHSKNVFKPLNAKLITMPDKSLGFIKKIDDKGLMAYDNSLTVFDTIQMDSKGLSGKGYINYLTSNLFYKKIRFFPDSAKALVDKGFVVEGFDDNNIGPFPNMEISNMDMGYYFNKDQDSIYLNDIDSNATYSIKAYEGLGLMKGDLSIKKTGVFASGDLEIFDSKISSRFFNFKQFLFTSGYSSFLLYTDDDKKAAISGDELNIDFNLSKNEVFFKPEYEGYAAFSFPFSQIKTSITEAIWDLSDQLFIMEKNEETDLSNSFFYSTKKELDSLNFLAEKAIYDINSRELNIAGIPHIKVADSYIIPNEGYIRVLENSKIDQLKNAEIILDTLNEFHHFYNSTINIFSKNKYVAQGIYKYINFNKDTFNILFNSFETAQITRNGINYYTTLSKGEVLDEDLILIDPGFHYKGKIQLYADTEELIFNGEVSPSITENIDNRSWIDYKGKFLPGEDFRLVLGNKESPPNTIIYNLNNTQEMSFAFFESDENNNADPIFISEGDLFYDEVIEHYIIESAEKTNNINSPEKSLSYNHKSNTIYFEGKSNLFRNNRDVQIQSTSNGSLNIDSMSMFTKSLMTLEINLKPSVKEALALNFLNIIEQVGAPVAHSNEEEVLTSLGSLIGKEKSKEFEDELLTTGYSPIHMASDELVKLFLFSNVDLKWSDEYKSWYNISKLNLANIGETEINASLNGFMEISKKPSGYSISLFIQPASDYWCFFKYENNELIIFSSFDDFNKEVFEVRRSSKDKYVWPDYGDEKISLEFVNNFIKKYFKIDKKFSFSSPFFPFSESEVFNQISDDDDGF